MTKMLNKKIAKGIKWTAIDNVLSRVIQLLLVAVLARLLTPEDFGIVAIALFFMTIGSIVQMSGFPVAYIRTQTKNGNEYGTLFFLSLTLAFALIVFFILGSSLVANYYDLPVLRLIMYALSFGLLIDGITIPMRAHLEKEMEFAVLTKLRLPSLVIGAIAAIGSAALGIGLWALIVQQIVQKLIFLIGIFMYGKYPSIKRPSSSLCREFIDYSWALQLAAILNVISREVNTLFIGKIAGMSSAGLYTRAFSLQALLVQTIVVTVEKVSFPALAGIQDKKEDLLQWMKQTNKVYSFAIYPCLALMFVTSEDIILFVFGAKWIEAAIYMQFLIAIGCVRFLQSSNLTLLKIKGLTRKALMFRVCEAIVTITMIFLAYPYGIKGLILGQVISAYVTYIIIALGSQKNTGYPMIEQLRDVMFYAGLAVVAGAITYVVHSQFKWDIPIINIVQTASIYFSIYLGVGFFLRKPEPLYIYGLIISALKKST